MDLCSYLGVPSNSLVQKVLYFDENRISYPAIVQEKYDGVFCIAKMINEEVYIFSRTGKEFLSMNHLKPVFKEIFFINEFKDCLLFFEAYIPDTNQEIISGYCRDMQNQHQELKAVVHDIVPMDVYSGEANLEYSTRFMNIRRLYSDSYNSSIILPITITAYGYKEISDFVERVWSRNGEGVVIKSMAASYQRGKRNGTLMKLKRGESFDLEVIDIIEGTGKYVGMVGKLVCRFKDNKNVIVGTGFTDNLREIWFKNPSLVIGKIVQINALAITKNGVLREPAYKGIRYDKVEPDY